LYRQPPADVQVLCLDELGPLRAGIYPAHRWCPSGQRPHITPDYGGRGKTWVFGAFEPRTGFALTHSTSTRSQSEFVAFLDLVVATWTAGDLVLIMDNLAVHKTLNVRLWALAYPRVRFLFQPTYSPWLNLIEPWWKPLRSLALKGRSFEMPLQVRHAILHATAYCNSIRHPYCWRKAA
jgi:DDE superfamily endonuclease